MMLWNMQKIYSTNWLVLLNLGMLENKETNQKNEKKVYESNQLAIKTTRIRNCHRSRKTYTTFLIKSNIGTKLQ